MPDPITGGAGSTLIGTDSDDLFIINGAPTLIDGKLGNDKVTVTANVTFNANSILSIEQFEIAGSFKATFSALTAGYVIAARLGDTAAINVVGSAGDDTIQGGTGNDTINGGSGHDFMYGGGGNDSFEVKRGTGAKFIDGGDGTDFASIDFGKVIVGLTLDISNPTIQQNLSDGTQIIGIERLSVTGGIGNDVLIGGSLDDTFNGYNGDDVLKGGGGNDKLLGGTGYDVAIFSQAFSAYTITNLGAGSYKVQGPDGTDTLTDIETLRFLDGDRPIGGYTSSAVYWGSTAGQVTFLSGIQIPDGRGANPGTGFTITGLVRLPDGTFYAANEGQADLSDNTYTPSIVHLAADMSTKLEEFALPSTVRSVQGVAYDDVHHRIFYASLSNSRIDVLDQNGNQIQSILLSTGPNALAYDKTLDAIIVGLNNDAQNNTVVQWLSVSTGSVLKTLQLGVNPDHLFFDPDKGAQGSLYASYGDSGRTGYIEEFDVASGTRTGLYTLPNADSIEGLAISGDTLWVANDGYIHSGNPAENRILQYSIDETTAYQLVRTNSTPLSIDLGIHDQTLADGTHLVGVPRLFFSGGSGNDQVTGGKYNDVLAGNDGNDTLSGKGGDDRLVGAAGDDILQGGAGDDGLEGGDGTDTAIFGGHIRDYTFIQLSATSVQVHDIRIGVPTDGNDTIAEVESFGFSDGTFSFAQLFQPLPGPIAGGAGSVLSGTNGNDTFQLDGAPFLVDGMAGNDKIFIVSNITFAPNSIINVEVFEVANSFRADLSALNGGYTISAAASSTAGVQIVGSQGADIIKGDGGNDFLDGGIGDDSLQGDGGDDAITGGTGNDAAVFSGRFRDYSFIQLSTTSVQIHDTRLGAADGTDTVTDVESFTFSDGIQTFLQLFQPPGPITGGAGSILIGTTGDDVFQITGTPALIDGLAGVDKVIVASNVVFAANSVLGIESFEINNSVVADLSALTDGYAISASAGSLSGVQIIGSLGADTITGDGGNDTLDSRGGNDILQGGVGDDTLQGGTGNDTATYSGRFQDYSFIQLSPTMVRIQDLRSGIVVDGTDTANNVESFSFSDGTRSFSELFGTPPPPPITGGDGSVLIGTIGDDIFQLTGTPALIDGKAGNDKVIVAANVTFAANSIAAIESFQVNDGFRADLSALTIGYGIAAAVNSTSGAQMIGSQGADTITGDGGNDLLQGGAGDDTLLGGIGNDTAVFSGRFRDYSIIQLSATSVQIHDLRTGASDGTDTITDVESFTFSDEARNFLQLFQPAGPITGGAGSTLFGTNGDDIFQINGAPALIDGQAGNDKVILTANVTFAPSSIFNIESFEVGNSFKADLSALTEGYAINAATGSLAGAQIIGSQGADTITGDTGNDVLQGGAGNDAISGGAGSDTANFGGSFQDYSFTQLSPTSVQISDLRSGAPDGVDAVFDTEVFHFSDGNRNFADLFAPPPPITGGNGSTLIGTSSDDVFRITGTPALIDGQAGNDKVIVAANVTFVAGGVMGIETFEVAGSFKADLTALSAGYNMTAGENAALGITATGSAGADIIIGGIGNDRLSGQQGDDVIDGGSGNDTIIGGPGRDTMLGGDGNDSFEIKRGTGPDTVDGGAGVDYLSVDLGKIAAGLTIDISDSSVNQIAPDGTQIAGIERISIVGGMGNDRLVGGALDDVLNGFDGNDVLIGGAGNDQLNGANGNDTLNGGTGNDIYIGGAGNDFFAFSLHWGNDRITDFTDGADLLDFRGDGLTFAQLTIHQVGADTQITLAGEPDVITLTNVNATNINGSDFLF